MVYAVLPFRHPIADRMEIIGPLVTGRSTLDLGVVDARPGKDATAVRVADKAASSLHAAIHDINADALGIDIDEEGVELLRSQDFNVMAADVVTMQLDQRFETIVAGDIIEHLTDTGLFLSNMREHLTSDGVLAITTPNPFYIKQVWKIVRYNRPQIHEDHTLWLCPLTLANLCTRSGLEVKAIHWVRKRRQLLKTWPKYLRDHFSNAFLLLAGRA